MGTAVGGRRGVEKGQVGGDLDFSSIGDTFCSRRGTVKLLLKTKTLFKEY